MFEVVLQLFFHRQVVSLIFKRFKFVLDLVNVRVRFAKLKLRLFDGKLVINSFLDAFYALVYECLKIAVVDPESFHV